MPAAARSEAPAKPAELWRVTLVPDAGYRFSVVANLAVHPDGTALAVFGQERTGADSTVSRPAAVAIAPGGALILRSAPSADPIGLHANTLVSDRDGFALAATTGDGIAVLRLARDGRLRARHWLPARIGPHEPAGLAADGRGRLLVHGGFHDGPHAPSVTAIDAQGRMLWRYTGRHRMPPGWLPTAVFRRDGGSNAVVIDREVPFWERRSPGGTLFARTKLQARHWQCRRFLGEERLVELFFNWEGNPLVAAPLKRWVLALSGPDGRILPGHVGLDAPKAENARCLLAADAAGWIAVSLGAGRIHMFDAKLALRAEIALSPPETDVVALAIGGDGAVTAILAPSERAPVRLLVRYAPVGSR